MSRVELIEELTDICIRQAEIIKAQAFVIEQLGAQASEDHVLDTRIQLLVGTKHVAERGA